VDDIFGTAAFSVNKQLYLNPGNSSLFPVFSQIAATYEEYQCNYLAFHYVTDAYSSIGTTASAGKVILATNYDPDDSDFSSSTAAENYANSVKTVPYIQCVHDVLRSVDKNRNPLKTYYVNHSSNTIAPVTNSTNGKFYDIGNFQIMTDNNAVTTAIGELWVEYEFTMIRPKTQESLGSSAEIYHGKGVPTTSNPFASMVAQDGSTLDLTFTNTTVLLPYLGRYLVVYSVEAATSVTTLTNNSPGTYLTSVDFFTTENTTNAVLTGSGTTNEMRMEVFNGSRVDTVLTGATDTIVGAATSDVIIILIPSTLTVLTDTVRKIKSAHETMQDDRIEKLERLVRELVGREESDDGFIDGGGCQDLTASTQLNLLNLIRGRK